MAMLMRCSPSAMLPSCRKTNAEIMASFAESATCDKDAQHDRPW